MQASRLQAPPATDSTLVDELAALWKRVLVGTGSDQFRLIEEHELTVSQVRALKVLSLAHPEPLPGGRIAESLDVSAAAMSRALDGLVNRGLLARTESAEDRRVRLLALTREGHELAEELNACRREQLQRFVDSLEPEQREALATGLAALDLEEDA
jgi:DNA-binding MarR family transcriptional regulator